MIHDFSPFLIQFSDSFGIRYYSLGYLLATLLVYLWMTRVAKYDKEKMADFVLYGFFSILIGGRLGHVFFYNIDWLWTDFLKIFRIWEGGMSFHGGLIAAIIWTVFFIKKQGWSFWKFVDALAIPAIIGVGIAKGGNFMNGELYGRPTDVPWCFVFPRADDLCRHPTQIYQGLGNILVGLFLAGLWFKKPTAGSVGSLFLVGYGLVRVLEENLWREPDWVYWGITSGTWLSLPMIIAGVALFFWTRRRA